MCCSASPPGLSIRTAPTAAGDTAVGLRARVCAAASALPQAGGRQEDFSLLVKDSDGKRSGENHKQLRACSSGWNPSYAEMATNETCLRRVRRPRSSSLVLLSVAFSREYLLQVKPFAVSSPFSKRVAQILPVATGRKKRVMKASGVRGVLGEGRCSRTSRWKRSRPCRGG